MNKSHAWLDAIAIGGALAAVAIGIWGYLTLPDSISTRFGTDGSVSYGPKAVVLLLPATAIVAYVFTSFQAVARSPKLNLPFPITDLNRDAIFALSREMACAMRAVLTAGFAALEWQMVASARGRLSPGLLPTTALLVAVLLATICAYVYRMSKA